MNQASTDGGITWQPAWIVTFLPAWNHIIPGTQFISCGQDVFSCGINLVTNFRATFALPPGYTDPSLTIEVHADNVATIFLNGTKIGQQTDAEIGSNFSDPPESFSTSNASLFQQGINTLGIDLKNFSGPAGLDYKAVITFVPGPTIDIKPQSCPNPLNVKDKGLLPVAILGTNGTAGGRGFDVSHIDVTTVKLAGVSPLRSAVEDVATPFGRTPVKPTDCTVAGPDGVADLTLKFDTKAVVAELGEVNDGDVRVLMLTGNLKGTVADPGASFAGEDVVVIVKKK